jgi:glutamyl-tRNA reductase
MNRVSLNLLLVGLDLKHSRLYNIEKVVKTLTHNKIVDACSRFYGQYCVGILSTCNRFELYIISYSEGLEGIMDSFSDAGINVDSLYVKTGEEAVKHLTEVACGYRSIAFGEAEILDQVREAPIYGTCIPAKGVRILFQEAYDAAKRLREKLHLSHDISLAEVAVRLLSSKLTGKDLSVMVVGYGKTGRRVVKELQNQGFSKIVVLTRNPGTYDASVRVEPIDNLNNMIVHVDAIITATSSTNYLITSQTVKNIPNGKKITIIDLALPRNVDPEITLQLPRAELYNIEDLIPVFETLLPNPPLKEEISSLIDLEAQRIFGKIKSLEVEETIRNIWTWVERMRVKELSRTFKLLTGDINRDRETIEKLTHRLVSKILYKPILVLRQMPSDRKTYYLEFVRKAFGVEDGTSN